MEQVSTEIIEAMSTHGLGAILSVALVFYVIKNQEHRDEMQNEREKNYQQLLSELSQKFEVVKEIQKSVDELKSAVLK